MRKSDDQPAEVFPWHSFSADELFEKLHSSLKGIEPVQARHRLEKEGPNELPKTPQQSMLSLFAAQFINPFIIVLLVAAGISLFVKEATDAIVIVIILLVNAIIGTYQEGKAQRTLDALATIVHPQTTVIRNGQHMRIETRELVKGDVVILSEGEKVPADVRLLSVSEILVDESALTGESKPVRKTSEAIASSRLVVADQKNMGFLGTLVVRGEGKAIVVATGQETQIGALAEELATINTNVPLKEKLDRLTRMVLWAVFGFSFLLGGLALTRGMETTDVFFLVVSMCVSLIPEGLPVTLTLVLAFSVSKMAKRNAVVKKLAAVDALGHASIIATDKTGTITLNELSVTSLWIPQSGQFQVTGEGLSSDGEIMQDGKNVDISENKALLFLSGLFPSILKADVIKDDATQNLSVIGDPTEAALLVLAQKISHTQEHLHVLTQAPFDYAKRYSQHVIEQDKEKQLVYIGAPDILLELSCDDEHTCERARQTMLEFAQQGLRVVAVALKQTDTEALPKNPKDLTLLGLIGMQDSIHPEAKEAIERVRRAGIRVVMITGDYKETAIAIARTVGIYRPGDEVLTGEDVAVLAPDILQDRLKGTSVFARVTPKDKLRLIQLLRDQGETVAMTGDGVNDAASLVAADLGIAMGKKGTDVAKEAADIVLLDDNFKSIAEAVREGRNLYKTIKNVIVYLLSTGVGEAFTIFGALLIGLPSILLPVQILWLNLITDGFLNIGLAFEPRGKKTLFRAMTSQDQDLIDSQMLLRMGLVGMSMAFGTLLVFAQSQDLGMQKALTMSLTTLAAFQWFNAWNCRSATRSLMTMNFFANPTLIGMTLLVVGLQVAALGLPFMQRFLHTVPLSLAEWFVCIGIASSILLVEEIRKYIVSVYAERSLKIE